MDHRNFGLERTKIVDQRAVVFGNASDDEDVESHSLRDRERFPGISRAQDPMAVCAEGLLDQVLHRCTLVDGENRQRVGGHTESVPPAKTPRQTQMRQRRMRFLKRYPTGISQRSMEQLWSRADANTRE